MNIKTTSLTKKLIIACCLIAPISSFAWEETGHKIVAQIAYDHLLPNTKKNIGYILNDGQKTPQTDEKIRQEFLNASIWPDVIKSKTKEYNAWHYINLNYTPGSTQPINTPEDSNNVVWAINKDVTQLKQPDLSASSKKEALCFLIHFAGDAHQPFHASTLVDKNFPNGDRGGNQYLVSFKKYKNLHALWDDALGFNNGNDIILLSKNVENSFPENNLSKQVSDLNPQDWANESFALGISAREILGPLSSATEKKQIPESYIKTETPVAKERMALAGYRLAAVLNHIFENTDKTSANK